MPLTFDEPIVVPVADPDDGERTARAVAPRLEPAASVVLLNVVEKADGAIDAVPREQRELYAEEIFERAREPLSAIDATVETVVEYGVDVVETTFAVADEADAEAVVFTAREGNRLAELLTGDVAKRLVKEASIPVVALPHPEDESED